MSRVTSRRMLAVWLIGTLVVLIAWEILGHTVTGRLLISRPTLLLDYVASQNSHIIRSFSYTAVEAILGLGCAIAFSLVFGLSCIYSPRLTSAIFPILVTSQIIPFICLAPIVILAFGFSIVGKICLSFLMCFFPLVTSIVAGIRRAPAAHLELLRLMSAPRAFVIRHVYLIFGLPFLFAGLRVAAPFSVAGAIVAEFNGAEWGIGKDMFIAAKRLEPELLMLGLLSAILLSAALYGLVLLIEANIGPWYHERKSYENEDAH